MKQKIFIIDSAGALFSALFLLIIAANKAFFGVPEATAYLLIPLPLIFSMYSFLCYHYSKDKWPIFLKVIATANLVYALLTAILTIINYKKFMAFGITYFIAEIVVIMVLSVIELKIAATKN